MKFFIKFTATLLLLVASISALAYFFWYKPKFNTKVSKNFFTVNSNAAAKNFVTRLKLKTAEISEYAKEHGYDSTYCFMMAMTVPTVLW